ncbi:MAG: hypothetical protein MZU84_00560 [Sphingobacterium sp.]|nr:hypothetical protein [Sphingobacterium sp.]
MTNGLILLMVMLCLLKPAKFILLKVQQHEPLEVVVYGIALEKGKLDVVDVPLTMAKLQMFFEVEPAEFCSF